MLTVARLVHRSAQREGGSGEGGCLELPRATDGRPTLACIRERASGRMPASSRSAPHGGPLLPSDRKEQSPLAPERAHPRNLCEPALEPPIVCGAREQILGRVLEDDARIRAQILDAVLGEPALHFADGVTMLLRMPILISQPRLAALRIVRAIPKNRIEGHDAIA